MTRQPWPSLVIIPWQNLAKRLRTRDRLSPRQSTRRHRFASGADQDLYAWRVHVKILVRALFHTESKKNIYFLGFDGGRTRARTLDPLIKSKRPQRDAARQ
jgi:hypothetical protein